MRLDFLNCTQYRNDIQVFAFDPMAPAFGKGWAQIVTVTLKGPDGQPLSWVVGGEEVLLEVRFLALTTIRSPIVGFLFKDRLGQALFGDNTYMTYREEPLTVYAEQHVTAVFGFRMPLLPAGDYSVAVAVAEGTQQDHMHHHWVHDAIIFKSHSSSVAHGLIGIPISHVAMVAER